MLKAPGQHAQVVERRTAILRHQLHKIDSQLEIEGLQVPFALRLAEATFAGNSLTIVGKHTPYQAVLGMQPALLPQLALTDAPRDDANVPDIIRNRFRVREIALQSLIEGTAQTRVKRALETRTMRPAEALEIVVGQEVEYYRPPTCKDVCFRWARTCPSHRH